MTNKEEELDALIRGLRPTGPRYGVECSREKIAKLVLHEIATQEELSATRTKIKEQAKEIEDLKTLMTDEGKTRPSRPPAAVGQEFYRAVRSASGGHYYQVYVVIKITPDGMWILPKRLAAACERADESKLNYQLHPMASWRTHNTPWVAPSEDEALENLQMRETRDN